MGWKDQAGEKIGKGSITKIFMKDRDKESKSRIQIVVKIDIIDRCKGSG